MKKLILRAVKNLFRRRKPEPARDEQGRYVSTQRQAMLMKARAMRAWKGLSESEALR